MNPGKVSRSASPCLLAQETTNGIATHSNKLRYHSITFNGKTTVLDWYYPPFGIGNWYGVTANYQMDGNYKQSPYSVYVDKFSLTYW